MRWTLCAAVCAAAIVLAPASARATGDWPWPLGSTTVLGYGEPYSDGAGRACTHGGIDIAGGQGDAVKACAGGVVSFAGLVPAGEGARAFAVTVDTADGLKVTYLPLERVSVGRGARVQPGDELGALAAQGDASSSAGHLHLGVKRGSRSIDPEAMLSSGSGSPAAPVVAEAPAPEPPSAGGSGASERPSAGDEAHAQASSAARLPAGSPAAAAVPAREIAPIGAGAAVAGAATLRGAGPVPLVPRLHAAPRLRATAAARDVSSLRAGVQGVLVRLMAAVVAALAVRAAVRRARAGSLAPAAQPVRSRS